MDENKDFCISGDVTDETSAIGLRKKRSLIFHFLYAAESFEDDTSVESIVDNFNRGFNLSVPLDGEIVDTVNDVIANHEKIDETIKPFLENWKLDRIGCCTKIVLRYAVWELLFKDTPVNIVINEAIELAKCFSEKDAYKFVNGVLDKLQKKLSELKEDSVYIQLNIYFFDA